MLDQEYLTYVMCDLCEESFQHFMSCLSYGNYDIDLNWKDIFEDDPEKQNIIAIEVNRRKQLRKTKLEVGLPHQVAPLLQEPVEL